VRPSAACPGGGFRRGLFFKGSVLSVDRVFDVSNVLSSVFVNQFKSSVSELEWLRARIGWDDEKLAAAISLSGVKNLKQMFPSPTSWKWKWGTSWKWKWGLIRLAGWASREDAGCAAWLQSLKNLRHKYAAQVDVCVVSWCVTPKTILSVDDEHVGPISNDQVTEWAKQVSADDRKGTPLHADLTDDERSRGRWRRGQTSAFGQRWTPSLLTLLDAAPPPARTLLDNILSAVQATRVCFSEDLRAVLHSVSDPGKKVGGELAR